MLVEYQEAMNSLSKHRDLQIHDGFITRKSAMTETFWKTDDEEICRVEGICLSRVKK